MSDQWKTDNVGWRDAKDAPTDPDWWYEWRDLDENGEPLSGFDISWGTERRQCRKRAAEWIAQETQRRASTEAQQAMAFDLLPVYAAHGFRCTKCGHEKSRPLAMPGHRDYGARLVLQVTCRRCKHITYRKPLDWQEPI